MKGRIFEEREKAIEEVYFHKEDALLIAKLRDRADLEEIGLALAEKLRIDDVKLLKRAKDLGVSAETAPALFLAPLVQVAWCDESVSRREQGAILRLALSRGIDETSPAYAQLKEWLRVRPADELFNVSIAVLKRTFSVLTRAEREQRVMQLLEACRQVALASAKEPANLPPLGPTISSREQELLKQIREKLGGSTG